MERKDKLKLLIDEKFKGNKASFSRAIERSPNQTQQWLNGTRNLGDAGARHIEMTLNLPQGWFDLSESSLKTSELEINPQQIKLDFFDFSHKCQSHELDQLLVQFIMTTNVALDLFGNSNPSYIKVFRPYDDGMEKTIPKSSLVFVDTRITQFNGDGIYLFEFENSYFLRRLIKSKHEIIKVSADNPTHQIGNFDIEQNEIESLKIYGLAIKALPLNYINL